MTYYPHEMIRRIINDLLVGLTDAEIVRLAQYEDDPNPENWDYFDEMIDTIETLPDVQSLKSHIHPMMTERRDQLVEGFLVDNLRVAVWRELSMRLIRRAMADDITPAADGADWYVVPHQVPRGVVLGYPTMQLAATNRPTGYSVMSRNEAVIHGYVNDHDLAPELVRAGLVEIAKAPPFKPLSQEVLDAVVAAGKPTKGAMAELFEQFEQWASRTPRELLRQRGAMMAGETQYEAMIRLIGDYVVDRLILAPVTQRPSSRDFARDLMELMAETRSLEAVIDELNAASKPEPPDPPEAPVWFQGDAYSAWGCGWSAGYQAARGGQ